MSVFKVFSLVLTASFVLSLGSLTQAYEQERERSSRGERGHPPRPDQIARQLGLDESQSYKFERIMQIQREKFHSFMENHKAETRDELSAILTGQQVEAYEEMMSRYGSKRRNRQAPRNESYDNQNRDNESSRQFRFSE